MNDNQPNPKNQISTLPDTHAAPSIWAALGAVGTTICAGIASYEAFHARLALWWALGAGIFMLIGFLAHCGSSPLPNKAATRIVPPCALYSWWKSAVLIFTLLLASVSMLWVDMFFGEALLLTAIVFHTYGGLGVSEQLEGKTRFQIIGFVVTWLLVIAFSVFSQFIYPAFIDLFSSFGSDLPLVTQLVMDGHSSLLLLPVVIGLLWAFWPVKTERLSVAALFGWLSIALMLMALASMYLPIIKMSMVV